MIAPMNCRSPGSSFTGWATTRRCFTEPSGISRRCSKSKSWRPEGPAGLVVLQRPAACDRNLRSVALDVEQLALPAAVAQERCGDLLKRRGKDRLQQLMRDPADRLL